MRCFVESGRVDLGDPDRDGKLLGKGGAGNVYAHPALVEGTCLKIYHRDRGKDYAAGHAAKVAAMVRNRPDLVFTAEGNTVQMAWPLDIVVDERGTFVGFLMPVVDFAHSWGGAQVIHPLKRLRAQIPMGQRLGLIVALNVAHLLQSLHASQHAVIDLKPDNLRVYDTSQPERAGFVALLDCDGFLISDKASGRVHPAAMATAEYAHPAWFDKSKGMDWVNAHGRDQDMFAAGVMFFQLLNGNIHPMAGTPVGRFQPPSSNPERLAAAQRYYAYGVRPNPNMNPDRDSLHPWMDGELRDLFDRTFLGATPPSPREWIRVLKRLNDPSRACAADPNHWRIGDECPHCALQRARPQPSLDMAVKKGGVRQTALGSAGVGTVGQVWQTRQTNRAARPKTRSVVGIMLRHGVQFLQGPFKALVGIATGPRSSRPSGGGPPPNAPKRSFLVRLLRALTGFGGGARETSALWNIWLPSLIWAPLGAFGLALAMIVTRTFADYSHAAWFGFMAWITIITPILFNRRVRSAGGTPRMALLVGVFAVALNLFSSVGVMLSFDRVDRDIRRGAIPMPVDMILAAVANEAAALVNEARREIAAIGGAVSESVAVPMPEPEAPLPGARVPVPETPEARRAAIMEAQVALKEAGYYRGAVDGLIGPATEGATRAFFDDHPHLPRSPGPQGTVATIREFAATVRGAVRTGGRTN